MNHQFQAFANKLMNTISPTMAQMTKANFFHASHPHIPNTNMPGIPVSKMTRNHSPQDLCLLARLS